MSETKNFERFSDEYLTERVHNLCAPFTQFATLNEQEKSGILHASLLLIATHLNATKHATIGALENAKYDLLSRDILDALENVDETLLYFKNFR
jgi:hypothetical protein